jgi:ribosomal protein L22
MNEIPEIEVLEAKPKSTRGRKPNRTGTPSQIRENKAREADGLEPINLRKPPVVRKRKSEAILPFEKKKRHQEILAQMLNKKSKYVVQKVLDKALNDEDDDQLACLKIVMDRILPAEYFTKIKEKSNAIQISIVGVDARVEEVETIDAEFTEEE